MTDATARADRKRCPHCGSIHTGVASRCPSTRLPIGGDPAFVGRSLAERYRVVRLLGDGGMGAVFKAVDEKLSRFVAIKVLHKHLVSDATLVERLAREARSAAAVGHPNIVDVLDFAQDRSGPLMVMEYLKGHSLAAVLEREGRLDVARACHLLTHALAGLEAAHARGVVHRDLKPANLMVVTRLGDRDFVKVCDFGFAAFVEPVGPAKRDLTPEHILVGTPSYAAPERWTGESHNDPQTDVYSAGVILYEMLAGRKPFQADRVSELVRKIRNEPPPPLRAERPEIPVELERVLSRALAKDPARRWGSAAELAEALVPFGGRRVERDFEIDVASEVFAADLRDIRAREAEHERAIAETSEIVELSGLRELEPEVPEESAVIMGHARAFAGPMGLALLGFLGEKFGAARLREVLATLPRSTRAIFADGIAPDAWVPYDAIRELMAHVDRALGDDDLRFVVECGRAMAERVFESRRELEPRAQTPERYFQALPSVATHLVRGVQYVVARTGPGYGRLELVEATDRPSITGCVATLGFLERSLVRAGARDVEVNLVSCRALGDERCMFDATWLA